jgi:carbon-monoxide dehydrogenase large subunit
MIGDVVGDPHEFVERHDRPPIRRRNQPGGHREILVPAPLTGSMLAASSVMGCLVSQTTSGMRHCGDPNLQCRRLDNLINAPQDGPIRHVLADQPALVHRVLQGKLAAKTLAGRAIEHGRIVVLRQLIGASVLRKEDARHLLGHGMFVADLRIPGVQDVAFVRSDMAMPNVRRVIRPAGHRRPRLHPGRHRPAQHPRSRPELAAHRHSPYPALADERVRYVGQPIVACMQPTRAQAEDLADLVELELDPLPAVVDAVAAMRPGSPRVFDNWPDNAFIASAVNEGDPITLAAAPIRLRRQFRMNRQATVSLECRGVLAYWDHRNDELTVHLSTQGGHVVRIGLAQALGLPENKVRVIAPDIGGGFGGKNRIMPEDIAVAAIAMKVGHPVRWIEDRREHLLASVHARDHFYDLTISVAKDGTLLGLEGDIYIDAGAYSLWPTGSFMEASMASRNLTGPYRIQHLALKTFTVATNKAPMGPYRGVARPGACFAIERLVDEVARELGREPFDLRRQNIVTAAELPYRTAAGMRLDTGDYVASLDIARDMINLPAIRARQALREPDGRAIGVGFAFYTEQSGHGTVEWVKRKSRVVPGYESANARMLPDGSVIIHVGTQNYGQGHETTFAQIAAHELSISPALISIRYGDTATSPFGFGSFGSRSIVFGGGAVARACRMLIEKIQKIGAHLLQTDVSETQIKSGAVHGPAGSVGFSEIAYAANVRQEHLPAGMEPLLDMTGTYEPSETGGVFAYGTHAVVVAVEPDTGVVEILDYAVSEDCGTMINPDGRRRPGAGRHRARHRHRAYEEIPTTRSASRSPRRSATTWCLARRRFRRCAWRISFIRPRPPNTASKGLGEGGAIAPPAAIANAVADAFRSIGASFNETPLTPRRVSDAVERARREKDPLNLSGRG